MHVSKIHAVLIVDIVTSSVHTDLCARLGRGLARASRDHAQRRWVRFPYAVTAGDEFQTLISDLPRIADVILDLRIRLRPLDLRIGVGLGRITGRAQAPVNRLDGPAFQLTRQALESKRPVISSTESFTTSAPRRSAVCFFRAHSFHSVFNSLLSGSGSSIC